MKPDPDSDSWPSFRLPGIVHSLHTPRCPQGASAGAQNMVGTLHRRIPERHDTVADKLVNGSTFLGNRSGDLLEIGRDLYEQIIRCEGLRMAGEILQIREEHRKESWLNTQSQWDTRLDELSDHVERNEGRKRFQRSPQEGGRRF